jgi:hypothetical protein
VTDHRAIAYILDNYFDHCSGSHAAHMTQLYLNLELGKHITVTFGLNWESVSRAKEVDQVASD